MLNYAQNFTHNAILKLSLKCPQCFSNTPIMLDYFLSCEQKTDKILGVAILLLPVIVLYHDRSLYSLLKQRLDYFLKQGKNTQLSKKIFFNFQVN